MRKRRLAFALAVLLSSTPLLDARPVSVAPEAVARFSIDRGHSAVEFVVRFMGLSKVRGRFADFSGAVVYDTEPPEKSTVALTIDVASIDTDNDTRDDHLRSPDWFDAERWPRITFLSRTIERTGPEAFVVTGPLTIKETTRTVSIPLARLHEVQTDTWGNWRVGFEGALTIDRKAYGVEGHSFFNTAFDAARVGVADEVPIEFTISGRIFNMERIAYRSQEKPSIGEVLEQVVKDQGAWSRTRWRSSGSTFPRIRTRPEPLTASPRDMRRPGTAGRRSKTPASPSRSSPASRGRLRFSNGWKPFKKADPNAGSSYLTCPSYPSYLSYLE